MAKLMTKKIPPEQQIRATTVICVRHNGEVVMGSDGQVTLGPTVVKSTARKVHVLANGGVLAGFAGATADAFTLLERFETRLESSNRQLAKAADALARDWRTDRVLRRLEAMLLLADKKQTLLMSGSGDVIAPENNIAAVGSGAAYAQAAAVAMTRHAAQMSASDIAQQALAIAGDICIYSNQNITLETIVSA